MLTEQSCIAEFNVYPDGKIGVKKVIDILRNGIAIARTPWRRVLNPNDPDAEAVLGDEPYYYNLALQAWAGLNPAPTEGETPL